MSDEQSEDLWTWLAPLQGVVACLACDPQREGANLTIVSKEAARSAVIFAPQGTTGCANSPSPSPPRLAAVLEHSSERKKGNAADKTPRRSEDPVGDESHRESAHQQQHPWRSAVESAAPDSNQQGSKGSFGSSFTRSAGLINVEFVRQRHETIVGEVSMYSIGKARLSCPWPWCLICRSNLPLAECKNRRGARGIAGSA